MEPPILATVRQNGHTARASNRRDFAEFLSVNGDSPIDFDFALEEGAAAASSTM
jgi:hypothetical protein